MGVLREELRRNLMNAGAAAVGYGTLRRSERLPYPALTRVVSFAVKLEPNGDTIWDFARAYYEAEGQIALLAEHARACLRRYGYLAEVMPKPFLDGETPVTEFPDQEAAIAAGMAERGGDGLLCAPDLGKNVRFGTVFTDAPWKRDDGDEA